MSTRALHDLTKDQLINLVLKQNQKIKKLFQQNRKQQPNNDDHDVLKPPLKFRDRPIPAPRKTVKQMVQDYEDSIILPPLEFRDDYKPIPKPRTKTPVPLPRTKIEQVAKAMKGYTKSFEIGIKNNKDPLAQLQNTRKSTEYHIRNILESMKGLKFDETLKVTFKKLVKDGTLDKTAYFNSKAQTIINNIEIPESLQLTKKTNLEHDSSMGI